MASFTAFLVFIPFLPFSFSCFFFSFLFYLIFFFATLVPFLFKGRLFFFFFHLSIKSRATNATRNEISRHAHQSSSFSTIFFQAFPRLIFFYSLSSHRLFSCYDFQLFIFLLFIFLLFICWLNLMEIPFHAFQPSNTNTNSKSPPPLNTQLTTFSRSQIPLHPPTFQFSACLSLSSYWNKMAISDGRWLIWQEKYGIDFSLIPLTRVHKF